MAVIANQQPWRASYTEGAQNNPADNTVLADTSTLGPGTYEVRVLAGADAAAVIDVEHRNAANDGTDFAHRMYVGPTSGMYLFAFTVTAGERIRVLMGGALTGNAAASIQIREL